MTSTETTTSGRAADDTVHGGRRPAERSAPARVGDRAAPEPDPTPVEAENRLVGLALDLVDAPEGSVGLLAPSSAESALLAVLAARETRPDVTRPAMVLTDTADPAYLRAARLLGVEPVVVESDPTSRAAIGPMAHAMDERTVLAVVSAPSPALGVVDPVTWIGTAAAAKRVPLHVDARAGGWLLALGERLGRVVPPWTFAAPGVTSLALDLPTGGADVSLLLLRDASVRRALVLASAAGPGAPRVADGCTPTDDLAPAAWRRVDRVGVDGYLRAAGTTMRAVEALVSGVGAIPGLLLAHVPDAAVVVLRTDSSCDAATIAENLRALGWYAEVQPAWRRLPPTLRITVDARTDVDALLVALESATLAARAQGPAVLPTRLLDHLARLDPTHLSTADVAQLLDALGLDHAAAHHSARFAMLLDSAHTRLRAALVARHRELLHRPVRG